MRLTVKLDGGALHQLIAQDGEYPRALELYLDPAVPHEARVVTFDDQRLVRHHPIRRLILTADLD